MSAGTPVSVVETAPLNHGLGHSRGHRSRSSRRSHGPISISASSFDLSSTNQQPPQPVINPAFPNGSSGESIQHEHHHTHSHTSNHSSWEACGHDHAVSSCNNTHHTKDDSTTGLFGAQMLNVSAEAGTNTIQEALAGLLLSLPWIALSWYYHHHAHWKIQQRISEDPDAIASSNGRLEQVERKTAMLTAVTLILYGCGEIVQSVQRGGTDSVFALPQLSSGTARVVFLRAASLALPLYAGLKVGGFLVAFSLLLAVASGVPTLLQGNGPHSSGHSRLSQKKASSAVIVVVAVLSFLGLNASWDEHPFFGYAALLVSVFVLRPFFSGMKSADVDLSTPTSSKRQESQSSISATSAGDSVLTTLSGLFLALITIIISGNISVDFTDMIYHFAASGAFALSLSSIARSHLQSPRKIGLVLGSGFAALVSSPPLQDNVQVIYVSRIIVSLISYFAARFDDRAIRHSAHSHAHEHHSHSSADTSKITKFILRYSEPYPLLYSILKESDSRRIFYFMCLNFGFMLVQLAYGFLTGSLGLLSDSIHMFFDCLALVVGLCAAVMSKWPPSSRFPYGYGKVDTLSGFANGIFLMIISIEIIYEAVERLSSGSQMHRIGELLVVSIAGLLVNLVGIMAFDHGHAHGHDHGHGHSHGNENMHGIFLHILADTLGSVAVVISTILVHYSGWPGYDPIASCLIAILIFASAVPLVSSTAKTLLLALPADVEYNVREVLAGVSTLRGVVGYTVPRFWLDDTGKESSGHHHHGHDHGHSHSHSHSHGHGHDHDHSHNHSHSHAHSHNHNSNHSDPHFSSPNNAHGHGHDHSTHSHSHSHDHHSHSHESHNPKLLGVIHVIASRTSDLEDVRQRTVDYLRGKDMDILVQVEREGDGRCWCGGGGNKAI
ncbi:metal cation transporter MSC2 [Aspergillus saccharolyticus JOP 1030-1]|uniref:Zinc transporter n=1 Tax=Aspergillus saccharolyticus JOP 1030-1 TaxID=1450539 RepID=A0A318ZSQ7_9EURO|nr:hypothetical protein BP01DRAFT_337584 [Aspergillus saccharolyticus JOP 1030-1]PYH46990.1 hypothetical protein BP01DRAFT_337584 [Aspergillus saccharolyticus JOP 1030-1]